jgi:hypothetical protein
MEDNNHIDPHAYYIFRDTELTESKPRDGIESYVVKDRKSGNNVICRSKYGIFRLAESLASKNIESSKLPRSFESPDVNLTYEDKGKWYRSTQVVSENLDRFTIKYIDVIKNLI